MKTEKEVETFYDNVSKGYGMYEDRICDKILEHFILLNIPKNKKLKILDAGGGIGRFSKPLLENGHDVVLLEHSRGMIEKAKQNLSFYKNISFVKESVLNMTSQKDNYFDAVLMMNAVLDYCGDYKQALKETFRILKRKGIILGNVNNRVIYCKNNELKEENYELFEKNMSKGDRYIVWGSQEKGHTSHEFTLNELKEALGKAGFKIKEILGIFNLLDKYELEKLKDKKRFIRLQTKYARNPDYINNSSDFFFAAQK